MACGAAVREFRPYGRQCKFGRVNPNTNKTIEFSRNDQDLEFAQHLGSAVAGRFFGDGISFCRKLGRVPKNLAYSSLCQNPKALAILTSRKTEAGIMRSVVLWQSNTIFGPAVIGVLKPRIVMPSSSLARLSEEDLKHVLMRELAHVRRHDMLQAWLMGGLAARHWFNPLMWLA